MHQATRTRMDTMKSSVPTAVPCEKGELLLYLMVLSTTAVPLSVVSHPPDARTHARAHAHLCLCALHLRVDLGRRRLGAVRQAALLGEGGVSLGLGGADRLGHLLLGGRGLLAAAARGRASSLAGWCCCSVEGPCERAVTRFVGENQVCTYDSGVRPIVFLRKYSVFDSSKKLAVRL